MSALDPQSARQFKALGHPVRLAMLQRLASEPETCACDFTDVFHLAQPTISQHLRVLREARLVTTRRRGTQICYSVDAGTVQGLLRELSGIVPVGDTNRADSGTSVALHV